MKHLADIERRMPTSIFGRLRLVLATVFVGGAVIAMVAACDLSTAAATDAYDRLLLSSAEQISESIEVDQSRITALPPDSAFETLAQSSGDRFFFSVRAPNDELLTGYPSLVADSPAPRTHAPIFGYRDLAGATMRTVTAYHLVASPAMSGWCTVMVAQSLDARHLLIVHLMAKIGAIILFVAILGYISSLIAVRRALLPFDRIGHVLAERRVHDTTPLDVVSPQETQSLVEAINDAFHRLNQRMTKLEGLAGIAAHQIRTPLSALSAQTELLLTDTTQRARKERVERLRIHIARLSRLTNQLLGQAMISYRSERVPHQPVELVELVHRVLQDAVPESLDRDLAVNFEASDRLLYIDGDKISLREALVNLVGNAIAHGAKSLLQVRIGVDQETVIVSVADDGPGIAPSLWETVIQPFRAQRVEGEGAGLGLAIAAEVAKAHGGKLTFAVSENGLFEISLRLPRADGAAK